MDVTSEGPTYERIRELGAGSAGRVWAVRLTSPCADLPAGTELALKEPRGEGSAPGARASLEREALVGGEVQHPGLARLLHAYPTPAGPALLFRLVPGPSLAQVIRDQGPLPEPQVRAIGEQLASALSALHGAGWSHGDVKPDNVRLDADGRAMLLDLGGARRLGEREGSTGTLPYLAPERVRGEGPTPAADIFALGVLLFELAAGTHPFAPPPGQREDSSAWLEALGEAGEVLASDLVPTLSPLLDACASALLDPSADRRPDASLLEEILHGGEASHWWRSYLERGRTRRVRRSTRGRLPLVGREQELEILLTAYEQVQQESCGRVVWLRGEPGSGKSRLVGSFAAKVREGQQPPLYLYGRCSSLGAGRPGHPVRALLRRWLHLPSPAPAGERERALLDDLLDPATAESLALILDEQRSERAPVAEPVALAEWLVRLAHQRPVLVFLDDLTYAGEESLQVIGRVAERLGDARLLFVLGLREGAVPSSPRALASLRARVDIQDAGSELELGPLQFDHVQSLVDQVYHHSAPRKRLAQVLHERSSGSPGALREIQQALVAAGQTRPHRDGSGLELLVPPDELPTSRGAGQLLAERFSDLDPHARLWLQRLAVVGGYIEPGFLLRAFPHSSAAGLDAILGEFAKTGWLSPAGARYRFARPAQREAVYRTLSPGRRRSLHVEAARALTELEVEHPSRNLRFQRAFHLHAAEEHARLLEVAPGLVWGAIRAGRWARAHTLAAWALETMEGLPPDPAHEPLRLQLLEAAAEAAQRQGRRHQVQRWLDQLTELDLDPSTHAGAVGRIYLMHGRCAVSGGRFGLARGLLRNADQLLERAGDQETRAEALVLLAEAQFQVGDENASLRLARQAARLSGSLPTQARAALCRARVALVLDEFEEALEFTNRAIGPLRRRAAEPGARATLALAHLARARIYRVAGRLRRAFASLGRARRWAEQSGDRTLAAQVSILHGRLLLDSDRSEEAETVLREAKLTCQESGYLPGELRASLYLSVLLLEGGDAEAVRLLEQTALRCGEAGLHRPQALSLALLARVAGQGDGTDGADAERLSTRAMDLLTRGAELADRVVIVATRAMVLRDQGRGSEADPLLAELDRRMRRVNGAIADPLLQRRQRRAARSLLSAASTPEGPVFPRSRLRGLPQ